MTFEDDIMDLHLENNKDDIKKAIIKIKDFHCLDKAKVKEVIEKQPIHHSSKIQLLKELGLEK